MTIIMGFLITVEIICSLLLLGVILLQRSKGQGMGAGFGAAMGESIFGAQMGNVLTKTTVVFCVIFLVNTILLGRVGTMLDNPSIRSISSQQQPPEQGPEVQPIETLPATSDDMGMMPMENVSIPVEATSGNDQTVPVLPAE